MGAVWVRDGRGRTECGYDVWYRVECCVCGCGVGEVVCMAVDAVGGEPVEFGGHCGGGYVMSFLVFSGVIVLGAARRLLRSWVGNA